MKSGTCFGIYHWAKKFPDKIVIDDGRMQLTYNELVSKVDLLAAGMKKHGVVKGDKIFVSLPNYAEFVVVMFACIKLGAVLVCVNLQFKDQELNYLASLMGQPKLAFMSREGQQQILKNNFPNVKIISVQQEDKDFCSLSEMLSESVEGDTDDYSPENDMLIVFTSGSSGVPKAVQLSVQNMLVTMQDLIECFSSNSSEIVFAPTPFCQRAGISAILLTIMVGGKLVTCPRFDGYTALKIIEQHRVTFQFAVTTMYAREIDAYNQAIEKPDISSLRTGTIGGSPVIKEYMAWFEDVCGCRLLNIYGMTECGCMIGGRVNDSRELRHNKIGKANSHAKIAILDNDGNEVPIGQHGEICCKSQGCTKGYYKNPEMTAALFDSNGWLHTGDIGVCDENGYISITGRKKEMIIRGGYNIFPAEVEHLFCKREDVVHAVMLPYDGGDLGEKTAIFLQMTGENILDSEAMREYAAEHLAKFKIPDRVLFIKQMPFLPTGKIDKVQLKDILKKHINK